MRSYNSIHQAVHIGTYIATETYIEKKFKLIMGGTNNRTLLLILEFMYLPLRHCILKAP